MTFVNRTLARPQQRSASQHGPWVRPAALLVAACAIALTPSCGAESFDSKACAELPEYDIRKASKENGVASEPKENGLVTDSPKSATEQQRLQQAAAAGCITLPRFRASLDETLAEAAPATPKSDPQKSGADAGAN